MKLEVIKSEPKFIEFKMIGQRHSLPNLLRSRLVKNSDVSFVSYRLEHPTNEDSIFVLRTEKGDPKKVLLAACNDLEEELNDFAKKVKKELK